MPRLHLALFTATTLFFACAPATPIRRSALVPINAPPVRVGAPLLDGYTQLSAEIGASTDATTLYGVIRGAQPGDVGLYIPALSVGASVYHAFGAVELGAHLRYSSLSWSHPSSVGVLPIPAEASAFSLNGGLGLRFNVRAVEGRVTFSPLLELNVVNITEAQYFCASCREGQNVSDSAYRYEGQVSTLSLLPKLGAICDVRIAEVVHLYGGLSLQMGFGNVGFDNDLNTRGFGSVHATLVGLPMAGVALDVGGLAFASTLSFPLQEGRSPEGLGLSVSLGYRWGS